MKKQFGIIGWAFVGLFGLLGGITVASATSLEGRTQSTPMQMPTYPTYNAGSAGTFNVTGNATFSGMGGAVFGGQTGFAKVEKAGYGQAVVDMTAAGNLCGVSCQSGKFTFAGSAGEQVKATAGAFSALPGVAATAVNSGKADVGVGFSSGKMMAAPAPRPW